MKYFIYVYFIIVTDIPCTSIQYQSMMKIVYPAYYGLPVTFVYWKSKKKNKRYIYIHCCELAVRAVTWVLRHKLCSM